MLASKQRKEANAIANELCISLNSILCNKKQEIFFATTEEMLYQIPFFEHYSNWNFQNSKQSSDKIEPAIISKPAKCKNNTLSIICDNGVVADIISLNATIQGMHPNSFVLVKNQKNTTTNYNDSKLDFSIILYTNAKNEYNSILINSKLANKMIVKLFTGQKINNFEQVFASSETPQRVTVYKLQPQEPAILPFAKEYNDSQRYFFVSKNSAGKNIVLRNTTKDKLILNIPIYSNYLVINVNKSKTRTICPNKVDAQELHYYDSNKKLIGSQIIENKMQTENVLRIVSNSLCPLY